MYRALYNYKSDLKDYLSFEAGDKFTALRQSLGDWIQVENGFGEIGFVPRNYVVREDNAALNEVLQSVDRAIQNIHYQAASTGNYSHQQRENLQRLAQHRENVQKEYNMATQASNDPVASSMLRQNSKDSKAQKKTSLKRSAPPPPQPSQSQPSTHPASQKYQQSSHPPSARVSSHKTHHAPPQPVSYNTQHSENTPLCRQSASSHRSAPQGAQRLSSHAVSELPQENDDLNQCVATNTIENGWIKVNHGSSHDASQTQDEDVGHPIGKQGLESDHLNTQGECSESLKEVTKERDKDMNKEKDEEKKSTGDVTKSQEPSHVKTPSTVSGENTLTTSQLLSPTHSLKSLPTSPSRQFGSPSVINLTTLPMPTNLASEIIEEVRKHTGLSYDKSGLAMEVVLNHIANRMPQTAALMEKILATFTETGDTSDEEESYDGKRIEELFTKLTECKDDSQQRSWALYEDQQNIMANLEELLSILEKAKPSVCRKAVAKDNYDFLHNLVEYYQMESRVAIRLALLKVFGAMCTLEAAVISHLLYSILPLELVSEIQTQYEDTQRLSFVTLLLTMIFSTGEPVPLTLHEQVDQKFMDFVLDQIESPYSADHEDQCTDLLVQLLLAYNLHFDDVKENIIMKALSEKGTAKVFTEKLLLIFNRGEDPVKMFDYQTSQPHSVMKFMHDLYSQQATSDLLYTNDAKVLIDIIIRQLTDLQAGDQIRSSFLTLTRLLVTNSDYFEHEHRLTELCERLMSISQEEGDAHSDKEEATLILQEFNSRL